VVSETEFAELVRLSVTVKNTVKTLSRTSCIMDLKVLLQEGKITKK